ncbi:MAG: S41 family peptidase [Planctomycetota bacterium]
MASFLQFEVFAEKAQDSRTSFCLPTVWKLARYLVIFGALTVSWYSHASAESLSESETASFPIQLASSPNLSPDGEYLAFSWGGDIWVATIAGTNLVRVTSNPADDSSPKFSPSGEELAFVSSRSGSRQVYLVSINLKDAIEIGTPKQSTFHSEGYSLHGWFPDGDHVLTTGSRDHAWRYARRMIRVNVRERVGEEVLVDATADEPSIAPDGKRVLFVREGERWWRKGYTGERSAQIWLYDFESEEFKELLHIGVDCRAPQWDGDRDAFFFTKGDYLGASLCRFDLETGEYTEVADFKDDSIVWPTVNTDGSRIVFRHLFDFYHIELGAQRPAKKVRPKKIELQYVGDPIGLDDERRRRLSTASDIVFSDDGLEMLFISGGDLWAMDTKLKEPIRLSETPGFESSPVLTEDHAFVVSVQDGQTDVWKVARPDGTPYWWQTEDPVWTRVTETPGMESDLRVSPDEQFIYFVRQPGDLMRVPVEGGDAELIVGGFSSPDYDLSPCGTWVAYTFEDDDFNDDVWIKKADGSGEPYNVSKHPDDDGNPRFSPDGKILAFTGRRFDEESDIYYVYLQASQAEETSRQRLLEEAIETMKKKRKSKANPSPKKQTEPSKDEKEPSEDAEDKKAEEDAKETKDEQEPSTVEPIEIDFDGLDDRLRRISISDSTEYELIFSPDGKKLLFRASVDGDAGTYSVTFPDELRPKKVSDSMVRSAQWTKAGGGILGLVSGNPAKMTDSGKLETYAFSARQTFSRSEKFAEAFDQAWRVMRDRWYDPDLGGRNWNAVRRKYQVAAENAPTSAAFGEIMQLMLGELNGSHNGFYVSRDEPSPPRPEFTDVTAHLGARFDFSFRGQGLKVKDVLPRTPAARVDSRLYSGDVITMIDGTAVDSEMDLTLVLNGRSDRDIVLTVVRDQGEPMEIILRPTTYSTARSRLYDHWLAHNRDMVEKRSKGRLGYLHIRSMDQASFYEFEKQLYRVGYGRDGLVIDVRDNGGGFTTDILLTALTQPKHAITVPRGGGPGYPQDRMVFATWQKPIIVLCNQNSFSNAEIFSHAIKNLKRGQVVGVQTAGGVISTGSVQIMDVGRMRMPFRAWFTAVDGEDMELNGALPHHVVWPKPGEIPSGKDRQLAKAIKVLMKEVKQDAKANPMPELIYNTDRDE